MSKSDPDTCPKCANPMNLHLTKVIDGEIIKQSVCTHCHNADSYKNSVGFDIIDSPSGAKKSSIASSNEVSCHTCGLTPSDFKEHGRLGCPDCYDVYQEKLVPLFRKIHNGAEHLGKSPKGRKSVISPEQIEALKARMNEHVSREEYELAAVVRDQLRSLES